jgi:cytochrome c oxidase cbb3-type subunit II
MIRFLRMSYLAAGIGGLGFFVMSVLLLGVWPGAVLEREIHATQPDHPMPLTSSEGRGRNIYGHNGCPYCHTQQIRYLDTDVRRFGRATLAWETIFDYPHVWGTRRIGPDLSRESGIRSRDWQFAHLYNPRYMVADSVMPPFDWMFDGAPDRPQQDARDLVAYLETLGRNRALAGAEGEAHARAGCGCSDEEKRLAFDAPLLNASAAMPRREGEPPKLAVPADRVRGMRLYVRECANCHGAHGEGNGRGADGLLPRPANLAIHQYSIARLSGALWNGVPGTSMPAYRDLPIEDLSALAEVVRGFHVSQPPRAASEAGADIYTARCAQCHGESGAGDGRAAGRFPIPSTDFRSQRVDYEAGVRLISNGIEGTPMAPWSSQLDSTETDAVMRYIQRFYRP